MEDEIFEIIAAEMVGEKVTEVERGKVERWRKEKGENERVYGMVVEELGEVMRVVGEAGGLDREKAYVRLEEEIRRRVLKRGMMRQGGEMEGMRVRRDGVRRMEGGMRGVGKGEEKDGKRRMEWWRYGGRVAAVLLVVGVGVLLGMMVWRSGGKDGRSVKGDEGWIVPGSGQVVLTLGRGEVVPLKRDTSEVIVADTMLRIMNEQNTLVYSERENEVGTEEMVYNTLTVPVSGEYRVKLADGTVAFLNSGSELRYPEVFKGERREVFLKGEAWFEVAKDSTREFWVHTDAMDVRVLGTSFNVNAYETLETAATTLVEGSVEVTCNRKNFRIVPGERFVYEKGKGEGSVKKVDTELYTSWKDGYYKFRQATLGEIMTTLSVWYGLNVFYQNEEAKRLEFTGKVKRYEDVRSLLRKFEQTENVEFEVKGNNVVIRLK